MFENYSNNTLPLYAYAATCIRAHSNLGGKGTKKIPHMQAYAGKNAKYFIFARDLACFGYSAKGAEVQNLRQERIGEGL